MISAKAQIQIFTILPPKAIDCFVSLFGILVEEIAKSVLKVNLHKINWNSTKGGKRFPWSK
jgi:hypothetical protein